MTDTENHKGQRCKVDGRLCQEGWCDGCHVWETRRIMAIEAKPRKTAQLPGNSC